MTKIFTLFTLFILTSFNNVSLAAETSCNDWLPFKDERCYKIVDDTTRTYDDSVKSCHQLDADSTLAIIRSKEEQDFLATYLFKTLKKVDNAWIGARFSNESKFKWIDNTDLSFINWDTKGAHNRANYCIQMQADDTVVGKWLDEPCEKKNLVLCQKVQTWTLLRLQKSFLDERKQLRDELDEAKNHLANLQNSHDILQNSHNDLKKNPIPVGFIYVQLPNQPEPKILWPTLEWKSVSIDYAGHFFRVEGDNAVPFGQSQSDAFQGHNHEVEIKEENVFAEGSDHYAFRYKGNVDKNDLQFATKPISDGINGVPRIANETRPINYSVRIWKRVS